jgi:hypothetical protein
MARMRLPGSARARLAGLAAVAAAVLAGCQGTTNIGSGGSGGSGGTGNASATGIWGGTDSASGLGVTGYVSSTGEATFVRADGVQFVGSVQVSGDTLAATVEGYPDFSATFSDGSTYGLGTLNGTVSTGGSMSLTLSFTTNGGTAITGSWSLSFSTLTNSGASLSAIGANYTDNATGQVLSISTDGVMSGQDASNGCVVNGSVTIADSSIDVYQVAFTYADCTGAYAVLNGVPFTGLAVLNPNLSPAQLTLAVSGASSTARYGIVATFSAS